MSTALYESTETFDSSATALAASPVPAPLPAPLAAPLDLATAETAELVVAAQGDDNAAFGELVARFERMVYAVCWQRLRDHAEVQEVSQDVFVKAFQKLYQLQAPAAFPGWLKSIAVRQSINRCTRGNKSISVEPHTLESVDGEYAAPLESLIKAERAAQVRAGLDRLKALDRNTLVSFYLKGQTLLEMSDAFAAPLGTIKRRLFVARKRLAKEIEYLQAV